MNKDLDIITHAVTLIVKAAVMAARFSGRVRKRSLRRLAAIWPIQMCVVIDHFSGKVMSVTALEGPNVGWINNGLEIAVERHGAPKHIISDQASCIRPHTPVLDRVQDCGILS
jgi:hypothetical protein